jgi:hypothetical protein
MRSFVAEVHRRVSDVCRERGGFFPHDASERDLREFLSRVTGLNEDSPLWVLLERFELGFHAGQPAPRRNAWELPSAGWR